MITRNCNNCQKEYLAKPAYLKRGEGIFCSKQCFYENSRGKARRPKTSPKVNCAVCQKEIERKISRIKKCKSKIFFCSRECQSIGFKDPEISVKPGPTSKEGMLRCTSCQKITKSKNSMCPSCTSQRKIDEWLNGNIEITYRGSTMEPLNWIKRYMIEKAGNKCEQCSFQKLAPDGRSILQMDHINGNYLDNRVENLRILCPNCHAMTPTYGNLNRGPQSHPRKYRRKSSPN